MNGRPNGGPAGGSFYVTGGTLRPDAPSYIERKADKELWEGLLQGEFCYVLTSRQMGKSSLMVRTVKRLREEKVAVAVLDLTAIGQNLTIEQWYDGLMSRLGQQLDLEDELLEFWHAHSQWGPLQRWVGAIEDVVLKRITGRVVIFVDEIDIVRSLPFSTDEFFAAIRESYNRRSRDPAFGRLAFGLLGVAAPSDLIRDTRMTPFNIGRRIELHDFSPEEAAPLARGLGPGEQKELLARILYWTGGHPYLTQRLCRALADSIAQQNAESASAAQSAPPPIAPPIIVPPIIPTARTVDRLAEKLFLSRQARDNDDNLVFVRERLLRSEVDVAGLLYLYRRICMGALVSDDDTNPLITVLRLSGIARGVDGCLEVRNRIYAQVFDLDWIRTNMPAAEVRRQRAARRRGSLIGFGAAVILVLAYMVISPLVAKYYKMAIARRNTLQLELAYRTLHSYRDTFETTAEIGVGGSAVKVTGSGSLIFQKPNLVNMAIKNGLTTSNAEIRIISDGHTTTSWVPATKEHQITHTGRLPAFSDLPPALSKTLGPLRLMPVYRLFLANEGQMAFDHVKYERSDDIDGQPASVLSWDYPAELILGGLVVTNLPPEGTRIPVTVWISSADHMILQMQMDLSQWASELVGISSDVPITSLILTDKHTVSSGDTLLAESSGFECVLPEGSRPVTAFDLPRADLFKLTPPEWQKLTKEIAPRQPSTPANCIDLTDFYNADKSRQWHPGLPENSLQSLPSGLLILDGVDFDVRGIVQVAGRELEAMGGHYPNTITGIPVGQKCRLLHFLQASGWNCSDGTVLGRYVVHYSNGHEEIIPIVYGFDLRDWHVRADNSTRASRAKVVWAGLTFNRERVEAGRVEQQGQGQVLEPIRLFKSTWVNPLPDTEIASIDFVSALAKAAPFLVALTAEQ